jgi:exopolyphosphatase/guanosine-5'-triphosphate,3'-diphosphate pyrophosphatase
MGRKRQLNDRTDLPQSVSSSARPRRRGSRGRAVYAALDLGTNNCRLLIAEPAARGFMVVDSFSRIVRLGEGLQANGRLSDAAMNRAIEALAFCAAKIGSWPVVRQRCIATQACRAAMNGADFIEDVRRVTGLCLSVISPREEAELAVLGCAALIDPRAEMALIVDIGGGSTELSWVDARTRRILAWTSLPFGVVTLAERHGADLDSQECYAALVREVRGAIAAYTGADHLRTVFTRGAAHLIGTSGAVTSLAGVMLGLRRYRRSLVDGVWMSVAATRATAERLRRAGPEERARNGCIGAARADLVCPGAAILEALFAEWPAESIRVADRGLREGVLLSLMAERAA